MNHFTCLMMIVVLTAVCGCGYQHVPTKIAHAATTQQEDGNALKTPPSGPLAAKIGALQQTINPEQESKRKRIFAQASASRTKAHEEARALDRPNDVLLKKLLLHAENIDRRNLAHFLTLLVLQSSDVLGRDEFCENVRTESRTVEFDIASDKDVVVMSCRCDLHMDDCYRLGEGSFVHERTKKSFPIERVESFRRGTLEVRFLAEIGLDGNVQITSVKIRSYKTDTVYTLSPEGITDLQEAIELLLK